MAGIKQKISDGFSVAKKYWNTPANGNYVPYKEVASLGCAGLGVHWTTTLASSIGLSAGNFLVGACIGLKPLDLQIMLIVANLIGLPIGLFRGWYFDNHHMKGGKFIPFMLNSAFPIFAISTVFVWLPYDSMSYIVKAVVVEAMYLLLQVFLCFYLEGFSYLQQIISPNAQERATVMSISQIIYSFAPTVTNFIIPTAAGLTYGLNNIWTYRIIYPAFTIIGLVFNYIFFRKVKERLIIPKHKVEYVSIIDALREVSKNKYFWLINGAGWIGFLEGACGVVLGWSFVYAQNGEKQAMLGVANTIIGNAALWAMLLAPLAIKQFGKRNLLIMCNLINVVLFIAMFFSYKSLVMICVIFYLNGFVNTFGNIYLPNINADMRDYHQWKTGVRIDGMFGPLGMIGTVLSFGTGLVVPAIYEHMGLHEDYDVLYNDAMRNNLFEVMIICSIIGAILNLIPYLFYDLTESKHKGYINVLKIRAMFEDYGDGDLDETELKEGMEIIYNARELVGSKPQPVDKTALKNAKKLPKNTDEEKAERKAEIKKARAEIRSIKERNEMIDVMPIVTDELTKFSTPRYQAQLEAAKKTFAMGTLCLYENIDAEMTAAKAMPKKTKEEKEIRSDAIALVRSKRTAVKLINKYGIENISYPTDEEKEEIENRETKTMREQMKAKNDLKALTKKRSVYDRATAPYDHAKRLIAQAENYSHLDDVEAMYSKLVSSTVEA
ncbi:MAG: MFS transporter [Eubacteriales bacterium]|nr:MFS transporter [Eubacteriales bacterium]